MFACKHHSTSLSAAIHALAAQDLIYGETNAFVHCWQSIYFIVSSIHFHSKYSFWFWYCSDWRADRFGHNIPFDESERRNVTWNFKLFRWYARCAVAFAVQRSPCTSPAPRHTKLLCQLIGHFRLVSKSTEQIIIIAAATKRRLRLVENENARERTAKNKSQKKLYGLKLANGEPRRAFNHHRTNLVWLACAHHISTIHEPHACMHACLQHTLVNNNNAMNENNA